MKTQAKQIDWLKWTLATITFIWITNGVITAIQNL
jgi:hypothetical protein